MVVKPIAPKATARKSELLSVVAGIAFPPLGMTCDTEQIESV
jgi:hypothetical protein